MANAARGPGVFSIGILSPPGEGDDHDRAAPRLLVDAARGVQSIQGWHPDIHQNHFRSKLVGELHPFDSIMRRAHIIYRRHFRDVLVEAELLPIRFHDLRHTAATLLLTEGVHPKVVQERLGHSSIQLTLDTYSHVLPTLQEDAAGRLDRLFGRASG